jgi:hypothetical protein
MEVLNINPTSLATGVNDVPASVEATIIPTSSIYLYVAISQTFSKQEKQNVINRITNSK